MAITLNEIKSWLDAKGLNYIESEKHDSAVHLSFSNDGYRGYVKIELEENGELIQVYCNELVADAEPLKVKDHKHQLLVLQYLLDRNYREKFGTWELDPTDGEVRFAVEIPLEDNTLTEKQFNRIMYRALNTQENFEAIHTILETGELPEDDSKTEALLAELMKMLEEHQQQNGADEDDGI